MRLVIKGRKLLIVGVFIIGLITVLVFRSHFLRQKTNISAPQTPSALPAPENIEALLPASLSATQNKTLTNNLAPVIFKVDTKDPVVFLTIDDGIYKDPTNAALMKATHIRASFFLTFRFIKDNTGYFASLKDETGSSIEDHTMDHKTLTNLSFSDQKQEICGAADTYARLYGRRPTLFRPPGGFYNDDTRRAALACGMSAVVMWHATVNSGAVQFQSGHQLQPGDIVLMHFRPTFVQDMNAFVNAMNSAGLHTELLEKYTD